MGEGHQAVSPRTAHERTRGRPHLLSTQHPCTMRATVSRLALIVSAGTPLVTHEQTCANVNACAAHTEAHGRQRRVRNASTSPASRAHRFQTNTHSPRRMISRTWTSGGMVASCCSVSGAASPSTLRFAQPVYREQRQESNARGRSATRTLAALAAQISLCTRCRTALPPLRPRLHAAVPPSSPWLRPAVGTKDEAAVSGVSWGTNVWPGGTTHVFVQHAKRHCSVLVQTLRVRCV